MTALMSVIRKTAVVFALTTAIAVPSWAENMHSSLSDPMGKLQVYIDATCDSVSSSDSLFGTYAYKYSYVVSFAANATWADINSFRIANNNGCAYAAAGNNKASWFYQNEGPAFNAANPTNTIIWTVHSTRLPKSQAPVTFWYYSNSSWTNDVTGTAQSSPFPASAKTLGMDVPEPGSLGLMGMSLLGLGSMFLKRIKLR